MPIAINPEHNDLADSVRSLVAKVAPADVLHEALETPISNPPSYWKAAAEQGLQGGYTSPKRLADKASASSSWRSPWPSSATARCRARLCLRPSPAH